MVRMNVCEYNQSACIQLSPFSHQVGGHSSMFHYDKDTVCKVLEPPELHFYQSMPDLLKKFTPEYRGTITVQYCEDELGYIKLVAQPQTTGDSSVEDDLPITTADQQQQQPPTTESIKLVQLRCSEDGRIDYSNSLGSEVVNYEQGKTTMSKINPWSLQLCIKQAEKLHRQLVVDENVPVSQQYILLEDVTSRFCHPCILDLKMGKRQYADIDSDKKRQSKIKKCESSTSATLGVRLCGMQVYQIDNGGYLFTDKYRGRILTVNEFRVALEEFFDNGKSKRLDVLPAILERLHSLYEAINFCLNYRFYSGSLLIVYDGLVQSNLIDIRMIDFAHSTTDESSAPPGPDKGYLFGLKYLIDVFQGILSGNEQSLSAIDIDP